VLTVTPRPITITADDLIKEVGTGDPALTYALSSGSLVGGDTLSGALTRDTGEVVGSYAILQGTLGNPNYLVTFIAGQLQILPITVPLPSVTEPVSSESHEACLNSQPECVAVGSFVAERRPPDEHQQADVSGDGVLAAIYEGEINLNDPDDDTR
jgi:hypothetical protein